jgi:hypothetical protein
VARKYGVAGSKSPDPRYSFRTRTKVFAKQERVQGLEVRLRFRLVTAFRRRLQQNGTDTIVCPTKMYCANRAAAPTLRILEFARLRHAAPSARRCWKHSRQKTGRPCVGRKGTVVSLPHCEHVVFVSERVCEAPPPPPPPSARLALQPLHLFGSFLNPLSAKNICSPAVKTNSAPHSAHFSTLSWYSMSRSPLARVREGDGHISH